MFSSDRLPSQDPRHLFKIWEILTKIRKKFIPTKDLCCRHKKTQVCFENGSSFLKCKILDSSKLKNSAGDNHLNLMKMAGSPLTG